MTNELRDNRAIDIVRSIIQGCTQLLFLLLLSLMLFMCWILLLLLQRYKAITKPLEYGVKRTPRRMIGWVALVWCMAGCISLAPLLILGNEYKTSETGRIDCSVCQNSWYQFYATMCSFYIPTTVMIYVSIEQFLLFFLELKFISNYNSFQNRNLLPRKINFN